MKTHTQRPVKTVPAKAGFSLIEILVVMAIIAILMTLVLGIGAGANRGAAEAKAKAELQSLLLEVEAYREDNGVYPPVEASSLGPTFKTWFDKRYAGGKYRLSDLKSSSTTWQPLDPWGNPYVYTYNPTANPNIFTLGSKGADGKWGSPTTGSGAAADFGKGDDITNRNGTM